MEAVTETENPATVFTLSHVVWVVTAALLGVGLVFRARGFLIGTLPLWEDEAAWAIRLVDMPVSAHDIRPLGFMAISKLLVTVFSPSEMVLRALPWLAGIGTLAMSPFLAKRLFTSVAPQLLFVAIIALHPAAIDLSKEFKPYSVSLAVHMALLLLALRYLAEHKPRDLALLLGLLFTGTLFCQDAVFTYPGVFAILGFDAFRSRSSRRLAAVALTGAATFGLLLTFYLCWWNKTVEAGTSDYWGKKYDVFYVKHNAEHTSRLGWTTARIADIAAMPGLRRDSWKPHRLAPTTLAELKEVDVGVWQVLGLMGCAALFLRERRREQVLLLGPLAVLVIFNRLGFWPLGAFRTNLFALGYGAAIAGMALDRREATLDGWDLAPVGALVLVPFLLFGRTTHATKSVMGADSAFPAAVQALSTLRQESDATVQVALDGASCAPWHYYLEYHPDKSRLREMSRHVHAHCTRDFKGLVNAMSKGLKTPKSRAYAVVSRTRMMSEIETNLPSDLAIDGQLVVGKHDHLVVRVRQR